MGYGAWSDVDYRRSARGRKAFVFSADVLSRPREEQRCHQLLDPFGLTIRESRDSAEHPESNAVMIGLDVTGSMARVVVEIRDSMGTLMEMLLNGRYIPDPQLLFYAVGDATEEDRVPFQISQFESDIRINEQITKVVLEGGGGGGLQESYEFGFYCAARHTSIDCFDKRGNKGYLFSIGDEMPYPKVVREQVRKIFDSTLQQDIPLAEVVGETQAKYHTFHIIPRGSSHYDDPKIRNMWSKTLGGEQFVFMLEDPSATAETIALAIGLNEGRISLEEGLKVISDNSGQTVAAAVARALEGFAGYAESMPGNRRVARKDNRRTTSESKKEKEDRENWKL